MELLWIGVSRWCGLSLATGLMVTMSGVPAWGQRSPSMAREIVDRASPGAGAPTPGGAALEVLLSDAMNATGAAPDDSRRVVVDAKLQGLVDDLLRRSPVFRRQWQRLARYPALTVRIDLVARSPVTNSYAATEVSARPDGALMAFVSIPGGSRVPELIGHEVEHVLEWLDGARLNTRHALGDASVRRTAGTFESRRAVLVGRLVAAEFARP